MKKIQAEGVETHAQQTEPMTKEEEQMLSKGVLGKHTPQALLNTYHLFFYVWYVFGYTKWQ